MSLSDRPDRMQRAAQRYAALGWYVFPLNEYEPEAASDRDSKTPHRALGKRGGHHMATIDRAWIEAFWTTHPQAGIGVNLKLSGLIAVDIDPKDNGFVSLAALEREHGEVTSPCVQITGSGGAHRVFRAPPGIEAPPGKVRGTRGIDLKWNGYIVLAPSLHPSGRRYRWQAGASPFDHPTLPELPAWTLVRETGRAVAVNGHADDMADYDQKCNVSLDEIAETLDLIPNDANVDYDTWAGVLAGIWHETDGSDAGRDLALQWSARSPKHVESKFAKSWPSFDWRGKGVNPVTFRYALKLAKPYRAERRDALVADLEWFFTGCKTLQELKAKAREAKTLDLDRVDRATAAQELQHHYYRITGNRLSLADAKREVREELPADPDMPPWLAAYVYLSLPDTMYNTANATEISIRSFDRINGRHLLTPTQLAEGVAAPEYRASDVALTRYMIPRVHNRMYLPTAGQFFTVGGVAHVNMYLPFPPPRRKHTATGEERDAVATVEAHFLFLVPDDRERGLLLSWLAFIVQSLRRPNWGIILQGPEKIGKSFVGELMGAVLGQHNVHKLMPTALEEQYNGWAEGCLLVVVEELKLQGHNRYDVLNRIKPLITDETIPIRRMRNDWYNVINTAAYLMLTNFRDALPITDEDSRYFMLATPLQTQAEVVAHAAGNPGYYARLYAALTDHVPAVRDWLHGYRLAPEFSAVGRAPPSAEHDYAASLGLSDVQQDLRDAWTEGATVGRSEYLFDATDWQAERVSSGHPAIPGVRLAGILSAEGFTSVARINIDGVKHRFYSRQPRAWPKAESARLDLIRFLLG